ncbi:receptor-like cytoplasmic kinase 176 [Triticum dicoccoides]|uniref:receptor-like cytoplasmic kinase 176 n=1 Tax=Triticum dicoccoides TaxID=85692 RepID=UPI001891EB21|nr:receptor-like cytoplasmic kinase 176 [Triticum dicoccoides]
MANCFRRPSTTVPAAPRSDDEILHPANLRSFTFKDLKKATRNFRPDSMLGEGGFGSVFKGWVDEASFAPASPGTGMPIAIKKLNQESFQIHKEWLDEASHLGRLSHPNLVKQLGYCLEDEQHLLVYEFMPQGSLESHLYRRASHLQPLSWDLRMKVALGAAKGLAFLHSDKANVIYGDFKTSDILLDSSYNAKLSDFGKRKEEPTVDPGFYIDELPSYYAKRLSDLGLSTEDPTAESNVYSFGVVLLEILAGRRRLDRNRPSGEQDLVEWARPHLRSKRQISQILDARLGGQYSLFGAQKAAALALKCLSCNLSVRPSMEQVVAALEQLQDTKEAAVSDQGKANGGGACGFVRKFGGSRQLEP